MLRDTGNSWWWPVYMYVHAYLFDNRVVCDVMWWWRIDLSRCSFILRTCVVLYIVYYELEEKVKLLRAEVEANPSSGEIRYWRVALYLFFSFIFTQHGYLSSLGPPVLWQVSLLEIKQKGLVQKYVELHVTWSFLILLYIVEFSSCNSWWFFDSHVQM